MKVVCEDWGGSPPISRVLSWAAIPLVPPLPTVSSSLPGSDASHVIAPLFGLAPDEACHAVRVATSAVGSYPTISPLPARKRVANLGGLFSVALSVALRRPAVNRHPALRGPDFPRQLALPRLPSELPLEIIGGYSGASFFLAGTYWKMSFLARNTPSNSPGSGGAASNCCMRQSLVSATYQRLPWLRM